MIQFLFSIVISLARRQSPAVDDGRGGRQDDGRDDIQTVHQVQVQLQRPQDHPHGLQLQQGRTPRLRSLSGRINTNVGSQVRKGHFPNYSQSRMKKVQFRI